MKIIVDGKPAVIKSGSSFDFVSENRFFMGREGYTLNISFPIASCPDNRAIFGHIERADVDKKIISYECSIITGRLSLNGTLRVVKVSESFVECQFGTGNSAQTLTDPFEKTFVDELDLGEQPRLRGQQCSVSAAVVGFAAGRTEVALPWVNEGYPEADNNWIDYNADGSYKGWTWPINYLSWQPYLIVIAQRICEAVGYSCDFAVWNKSLYKYLILCNTLPSSWNILEYARIMPHWTVTEFFDNLELLLGFEFVFDHRLKTVTAKESWQELEKAGTVAIDNVVDEYSAEIATEENVSCDYIASKKVAFKEVSNEMGKYYDCDWFINRCPVFVLRYPSLSALISANKLHKAQLTASYRWGEEVQINHGTLDNPEIEQLQSVNLVLYAEAEDRYFVMRSIGYMTIEGHGNVQKYILQPINVFSSGVVDDDDEMESLDLSPVPINDTYVDSSSNRGPMMFLNPGSLENASVDDNDDSDCAGVIFPNNKQGTYQTWADQFVKAGENEAKSFYDSLNLAFWDGKIYDPDGFIYPMIDSIGVSQSWKRFDCPYTLRMRGFETSVLNVLPVIDAGKKFKFSWLDDEIPNPRALFLIKGKRYVCEKITATFTENGMSQLLKGEFFPVLEED